MRRILFAALMCGAAVVHAQANWPDKPITMIVPFPPGGVADTVARPVAEALGRELKQQVIVDNKAGAGGATGIGAASRAAPDGYTVLLSLSSISILPEGVGNLSSARGVSVGALARPTNPFSRSAATVTPVPSS